MDDELFNSNQKPMTPGQPTAVPPPTRTPPAPPLKADDRKELMDIVRRLDKHAAADVADTASKLTILHAIESAQRWNLIRDCIIIVMLGSIFGLGVWRTYYIEDAIETQACGRV